MKKIAINSGLDIPITGEPQQQLVEAPPVNRVGITGDDFIGLKPTMLCAVGDHVEAGQKLFEDKKTPGVCYTAPACGTIIEINRGKKRKFESLVIDITGEKCRSFLDPTENIRSLSPAEVKNFLVESGLWATLRTRPYGKVPKLDSSPHSIFITAADTNPLAPSPAVAINSHAKDFAIGVDTLLHLFDVPFHLCTADNFPVDIPVNENITHWHFSGPHPAGLASTHIHFIDPVNEDRMVFQINYQDVISIGYLFRTGHLLNERIISLAGPAVKAPSLMKVPMGADLTQLVQGNITQESVRILSGSVLDGREQTSHHNYLGRFHNQVSVISDDSGRSFFNWFTPGNNRFSVTRAFASALNRSKKFNLPTATWGGPRALYPLGYYDKVMPLDIIANSLLKAIAAGETEKAKDLGALELIEEDIALCSFVCPGKNSYGPMLRDLLTTVEREG